MGVTIKGIEEAFASIVNVEADINNIVVDALCSVLEKEYQASVSRPEGESWHNVSGNTRSSIGYGVALDGEVVRVGGFMVFKNGSVGAEEGKNLVGSLLHGEKGISAVILCAVDYAEHVQDIKGIDILNSAELDTEKELEVMGQKINVQVWKL